MSRVCVLRSDSSRVVIHRPRTGDERRVVAVGYVVVRGREFGGVAEAVATEGTVERPMEKEVSERKCSPSSTMVVLKELATVEVRDAWVVPDPVLVLLVALLFSEQVLLVALAPEGGMDRRDPVEFTGTRSCLSMVLLSRARRLMQLAVSKQAG